MKFTRRDLLVWGAGAAAGLMVTPVPWKLLDDTSIWSQNWPWIPQPARGPVEIKQSACTLCPNGCGVRVRMASGWPVGVAGAASHPLTRGGLCPLAFAAHQLNWHPDRLRTVRHRGAAASWDEARAAFVKASGEGPVFVIDGYPGRAASAVLESFAQKRGEYRVLRGAEARALVPYENWTGTPAAGLGYDLENSQTIVSFGAPLLDGWGIPGRFTRIWAERASGMADPQLRLIQVDDSLSRTAARAWQWIALRPGSEAALAAGIARVLVEERLLVAHGPIPSVSLVDASQQTGLELDAIRALARNIIARTPAVAIARDNEPGIAALNALLGAVGASGGIVRRLKGAKSYENANDEIPSARAVLIDSSVPWNFAPQTDAEVFRFAAWDDGSSKADWLLPAPGFLEELTDIPTAPTSGRETYAIATSLAKAAHKTENSAQFLADIDPSLLTAENIIHKRCADLFRSRAGSLHAQNVAPISGIASAKELEEQLRNGAVWVNDPDTETLRCELKQWPETETSTSRKWSASWLPCVMPALASKLYQESDLRELLQGRNA